MITNPDMYRECGDGWKFLIDNLILQINVVSQDEPIKIAQIKEKFGGLRFYIEKGSDIIYELIDDAEEDSYNICEVCGDKGKLRTTGWYKTLCDKHEQERQDAKTKKD